MDAGAILSLLLFLGLGAALVYFVIRHMKKNNDPFLDRFKD